MSDFWSRCMMAPPTSSRGAPVGGTGRPICVSTALFVMTLILIYLIILFPRPFLFTPETAQVLALMPKQESQPQKRTEPDNKYKYLNDTNSRMQIPLFNVPFLYKVRFKLYMPYQNYLDYGSKNWTTDSYAVMYFTVYKTNTRLQVHAVNLHVGEVYIKDDMNRSITVKEVSRDFAHVLDIHTEHELIENMNYSLHIHYTGKILLGKNVAGLHASHYMEDGERKYMVSTHCQAQEARSVLPCIDVPEAKAKFLVKITHPLGTTAVANAMETKHSRDGEWVTTSFEASPHMSTYLFAFAVSNFPFIETSYNDIRIRIFAEKSKIGSADLALQTIPLIVKELEDYFTISIPLKKLDFHQVPQLKVTAMENWGLITSVGKVLFYQENETTHLDRYNVLNTMAHETAHQWFGNLVTMKWWNNLWLNEGFATLIGTKVLEKLGEYQFNNITQLAVILRQEINSPTAISRRELPTFSPSVVFPTAYTKPAIVMRMIEQIVGEDSFRLGVIRFLKRFSYSNADHEDLMEALSYAHDSQSGNQFTGQSFSLTDIIESWIYQKGYPIIRLDSRDDGLVVASQTSCHGPPSASMESQHWIVPLFVRDPLTQKPKVDWLADNGTTVFDLGEDLVLDGYVYSFARISYDKRLYTRIAKALKLGKDVIPLNSRSRILDDLFTAAEHGEAEYSTVFNLVSYLINETAANPFVIFSAHLDMFYSRLNVCTRFYVLKQYVASIFGPKFIDHQQPGIERTAANAHIQELVCKRTCGVGFIPCITVAKDALQSVKDNCADLKMLSSTCNSIPAHLRRCYYGAVVMFGDQEYFDYLFDRYLVETDAEEKTSIWIGLGGSKRKDDIWKIWEDFIFHQQQAMEIYYYRLQIVEFSKYYHPDPNFTSFAIENAEKIVHLLNREELVLFLTLLGRSFSDPSQKPQYAYVASMISKKFPLPAHMTDPARLDHVFEFRESYSEILFDIIGEELKTMEIQPVVD